MCIHCMYRASLVVLVSCRKKNVNTVFLEASVDHFRRSCAWPPRTTQDMSFECGITSVVQCRTNRASIRTVETPCSIRTDIFKHRNGSMVTGGYFKGSSALPGVDQCRLNHNKAMSLSSISRTRSCGSSRPVSLWKVDSTGGDKHRDRERVVSRTQRRYCGLPFRGDKKQGGRKWHGIAGASGRSCVDGAFSVVSEDGRWRIRQVDRSKSEEIRRVVSIQAQGFHEPHPIPFVDSFLRSSFRAEVLSEMLRKLQFNPKDRFVMLVAEPVTQGEGDEGVPVGMSK